MSDPTLVDRLRATAHSAGPYASDVMREAADALERMQTWLEADCCCPCCAQVRACLDDCTFAADDPDAAERMEGARAALYGTTGDTR